MKRLAILGLVVAAVVAAQVVRDQDGEDDGDLALEEIPAHVLDAARIAFPGIEMKEGELERILVYEIEGTLNGEEVEVLVTRDGKVIGIEREGDDDDSLDAEDDDDDGTGEEVEGND